jgi:transcriptional regulator with XRE-family HTH domain
MDDLATLARMTIGEKIRAMRKAAGLTQEQLAQRAGGHPQKWVSSRERETAGTTTVEAELLAQLTGHRAELVVVPVADSDLIEALGGLDPEGARVALRIAKIWPDLDAFMRDSLINALQLMERELAARATPQADPNPIRPRRGSKLPQSR